jgi:hypothetical protein
MSALDRLPVDSPFRLAAEALRSSDPTARREVSKQLKPFLRPMWEAPAPLEEPLVLAVALREVGLHHAHLRARTFELGCERSELVGTDGEVEHQLGA